MVPGSPREAAREQGGGFASRDEPLPQCPSGMGQLAHKEPWDMQVHIDPLVLFLPQQSSPWHPPRSFLRPTLGLPAPRSVTESHFSPLHVPFGGTVKPISSDAKAWEGRQDTWSGAFLCGEHLLPGLRGGWGGWYLCGAEW